MQPVAIGFGCSCPYLAILKDWLWSSLSKKGKKPDKNWTLKHYIDYQEPWQ
jgi:hypothetical protein